MGNFTDRLTNKQKGLYLLVQGEQFVVLKRPLQRVGGGALWVPVFRDLQTANRVAKVQGEALGRHLTVGMASAETVKRFLLEGVAKVDLIYVEGGPNFICTPLGGDASVGMLREEAELSGDEAAIRYAKAVEFEWLDASTLRSQAARDLREWVP